MKKLSGFLTLSQLFTLRQKHDNGKRYKITFAYHYEVKWEIQSQMLLNFLRNLSTSISHNCRN